MRLLRLFPFMPLLGWAEPTVPTWKIYTILGLLLFSILLFFWAVYKAIKTQEKKYMLAMLPFFLFMAWMMVL